MVRIWDLPTRLFHWLFAAACVIAWLSGDEPRYTDLHLFSGYLAVGLVGFRLVWGVAGGRYARFSRFVRGPAAVFAHLRQLFAPERSHQPGHNPAGAVAIVVMLVLVFTLGVTGLVVLGGEEGAGPLAGLFTVAEGVALHGWHEWLAWALLTVVLLHLGGVALESVLQRRNLPRSMVTGNAPADRSEAEPHNAVATAVLMLLAVSGFAVSWFYPYLQDDDENPYRPFVAGDLKRNQVWQEACSECHIAYHPSLLPNRSWQRMLNEQSDHFGEDLFLAPETIAVLRRFTAESAADRVDREVSWRTLQSLNDGEAPLRITDTPYWKSVHREIAADVWKRPSVNGKFNCAACHQDAGQGGFMNGAMRIPEEQ